MMKKNKINDILVYAILAIITVVSLIPFLWMVSTSLKDNGALMSLPIKWIPEEISFASYEKIFTKLPFLKALGNSVLIAVSSTLITVLSASLGAFVFAKMDFKGKNILFMLFLGSMMIPIQVTSIPLFMILRKAGLVNTYIGVILPSMFNAFAIFLLKQNMMSIPNAYLEAAVIDGAPLRTIFTKIVLPMSKVPLITLFVINFMNYWNDYFWPLIVLQDPNKMTLPVALSNLNSQFGTEYNTLMAGALISLIPILIVYLFAQKYFIQGIQEGGVK